SPTGEQEWLKRVLKALDNVACLARNIARSILAMGHGPASRPSNQAGLRGTTTSEEFPASQVQLACRVSIWPTPTEHCVSCPGYRQQSLRRESSQQRFLH